MARSKAATKAAKAAYSRRYRASKEGAAKYRAYNKKTSMERSARNKARRLMKKKVGASALKGKEVHHKNTNPKDNSKSNLTLRKSSHEGGAPGNQNARKKHIKVI